MRLSMQADLRQGRGADCLHTYLLIAKATGPMPAGGVIYLCRIRLFS